MGVVTTVRALIINPAGELLLIRRGMTDPRHPGKWDIPGGKLEHGEALGAALVRESLEEVGIQLHSPKLVFTTSGVRPAGTGNWLFFLEKVPANIELHIGAEHDDYKWVPFNDFEQYTDYDVLLRMHAFIRDNHLLEDGSEADT